MRGRLRDRPRDRPRGPPDAEPRGAQGVRLIEGLVASVAEAREGQGGAGAGGALPFLHRVGAQLAAELQVRWMGPGSARTRFINESC